MTRSVWQTMSIRLGSGAVAEMATVNIEVFRGPNAWNITGNKCQPVPCKFPGDTFDFRVVESPEAQLILGFLQESERLFESRKSKTIDNQGLVDGLNRSQLQVCEKYPDFDRLQIQLHPCWNPR